MKIRPYTQQEKEFILRHHDKLNRRQIAKALYVNINYANAWCTQLCGAKKRLMIRDKEFINDSEYFVHDPTIATI